MGDNGLAFAVTYDYRCPFARNACEHVILALEAGAPWDVRFWPFSLHQVHVAEGEPDVWRDPSRAADLLAMQVGLAVRDGWPERFNDTQLAIFAARHDRGLDLRDEGVLRAVLEEQGLDPAGILSEVAAGGALEAFRTEHELASQRYGVFGVPTFVVGEQAAFIRIMHRPNGNAGEATRTIERIVGLVDEWPALNELKHTRIPR
jgi:DSBA-like thioredoxin domain